jgi:transcriptional adapter 2-alpha
MDFALFEPTWCAEDELVLLDAIEANGLGNWEDVAEQLNDPAKDADECRRHYYAVYLDSATAPLPDPSRVLAQSHVVEVPAVPKVAAAKETVVPFNVANIPKPSFTQEETSATYNPLRAEFEIEWENDVELALKDIAFTPEDTEAEREIKHRALIAYHWFTQERARRRKVILEKGLLDYRRLQAADRKMFCDKGATKEPLAPATRELATRLRALVQAAEGRAEFEELLQRTADELLMRRKIEVLQAYRAAGVRSFAEGQQYDLDRQRRELDRRTADEYDTPAAISRQASGLVGRPPKKLKSEVLGAKGGAGKGGTFNIAAHPGVALLSDGER